MNNFDRRYVDKMISPFTEDFHGGALVGTDAIDASIVKAHAASIALVIKSASDSVVSELDSIDQRLGQVLVGLDQLRRIVDRLDQLNERVADLEVTG